MDATRPDAFFLAPDTGHLLAGGSDPVEVFRTYQGRIVHAHLKDYRPAGPAENRGSFAALGDGSIDFPAIVEIVASRPFEGWLNVELDGGRGLDPADVARQARDYVTGTLKLSLGGRNAA
jgi:inosose dehydratase